MSSLFTSNFNTARDMKTTGTILLLAILVVAAGAGGGARHAPSPKSLAVSSNPAANSNLSASESKNFE
jgi:hypothetical protein